jgi:hypothetical protein
VRQKKWRTFRRKWWRDDPQPTQPQRNQQQSPDPESEASYDAAVVAPWTSDSVATITLLVLKDGSARLKWRPLTYQETRDSFGPSEQDRRDEEDEISARLEEWSRENAQKAEYAAADWGTRMRHLGLLPPRRKSRLPFLKVSKCECEVCRPVPFRWPSMGSRSTSSATQQSQRQTSRIDQQEPTNVPATR